MSIWSLKLCSESRQIIALIKIRPVHFRNRLLIAIFNLVLQGSTNCVIGDNVVYKTFTVMFDNRALKFQHADGCRFEIDLLPHDWYIYMSVLIFIQKISNVCPPCLGGTIASVKNLTVVFYT